MGNSIIIENVTPEELLESVRKVVKQEIAELQIDRQSPKYFTRREVADLLKITLPTLFDYTRTGKIKGHRIGSRVLYLEEEVTRAVKEIATVKYSR
ncbi:MAG TPA: helix-turn-helix domain-containing protein [Bacteroidales bacterium]|nr:helix-turn-helix domain-containing protein [Bacteroidales bacterium]